MCEKADNEKTLQMYIGYRDNVPIKYRYGPPWAAVALMIDGGYDTPEAALAAWETEQTRGAD